ncbi:MAG TPA: DUF599 domain-containing protein [Candidatus Sulfotelmatobacter sp.]|nr:DUF599 domain-containing protein [Candidatus Sulfotelmatobacter sp.]
MPLDASPLDVAALAWFLIVWLGYGRVSDRVTGRAVGLNHHMVTLREVWMRRMLQRDNRIMDSQLIGHTVHSVTFFASTTMLVLAGLVGVFGGVDRVYEVVGALSFTVQTSKQFFEAKMLLVIGIFVYGFFKFTWSLRQFNYLCALIGSAPLNPVPPEQVETTARTTAMMLTEAMSSSNAGMRSYYFAFAAIAWFIQPWLFIVATTWMLAVLVTRQVRSRSFMAIIDHLRQHAAPGARPPEEG